MHDPAGADDPRAQCMTDALMAQTDSQKRYLEAELLDDVVRNACLNGSTGTWGDNQVRGTTSRDLLERHLVVADHAQLQTWIDLAETLNEVLVAPCVMTPAVGAVPSPQSICAEYWPSVSVPVSVKVATALLKAVPAVALMPVAEALQRVLADARALSAETVALNDALGRVLTEDVKALRTQPPAAVSAMDGSFQLSDVIPGMYSVMAEKEGFSQLVVSSLQVSPGKIALADNRCQIGTAAEFFPSFDISTRPCSASI